jgi:hypothetical protein
MPPVARVGPCDCRGPVHHGHQRTTFKDDACACAITCATQSMTLPAKPCSGALFLDHGGDLWVVDGLAAGQWDWSTAGHIHEQHHLYNASLIIGYYLRQIAAVLRSP